LQIISIFLGLVVASAFSPDATTSGKSGIYFFYIMVVVAIGTKLFGKRKLKTNPNKSLNNACFAGSDRIAKRYEQYKSWRAKKKDYEKGIIHITCLFGHYELRRKR